jgi:hypothetical protein
MMLLPPEKLVETFSTVAGLLTDAGLALRFFNGRTAHTAVCFEADGILIPLESPGEPPPLSSGKSLGNGIFFC